MTTRTRSSPALRRPTLNFIVDSVGLAGFVLLTTTGVLMRYVLPPGSGHFTTLWTLDRHEWGSIHFWLSIVFLTVLSFHLFLHWRWIVAVLRGRPREGSGVRVALGIVGLFALLALASAPFFSPIERTDAGARAPGWQSSGEEHLESIRGFLTLAELEEATGTPADHVIEELGLPPGVDRDERLGRLKTRYGFAMSDVRHIVESYQRSAGQP